MCGSVGTEFRPMPSPGLANSSGVRSMHKAMKRNQEQFVRQAGRMRERAVAQAMKRKEEYLGARVPRELKDRVLERAQELGIPASILIRQVLEEAFDTVQG